MSRWQDVTTLSTTPRQHLLTDSGQHVASVNYIGPGSSILDPTLEWEAYDVIGQDGVGFYLRCGSVEIAMDMAEAWAKKMGFIDDARN